jgi:SET domain
MTSTHSSYLKDLCATCSEKRVEFRLSPVGGLGGFAVTSISKDEVIFAIPRSLILSSSCPVVLQDPRVAQLAQDPKVTGETLLCAYMAWNRSQNEYLASLPPDYTPLIPSELRGTNVGAQLQADAQELASQQKRVEEIHSLSLSLEALTNARALYNSRRYPLRFALRSTDGENTKKRKHSSSEEERAVYDPTQGCMCPLLDVLNHQSNTHCLRFEVTETTLNVLANQDMDPGTEIVSNYDYANNDQSLLQFGFVDPSSRDVFTVRVGGQRYELSLEEQETIPEELLGDGGYGLEQHLLAKQKEQAMATPSENSQVRAYMEGQRRVLEGLLDRVREYIRMVEEEEEEEEEATGG